MHRRIQDFVRGGGPRPSWPPGGGRGQGPLGPPGSAPDYLGEQFFFFFGGGGQGPLAPPLDPRLICRPTPYEVLPLIAIFRDFRGGYVLFFNRVWEADNRGFFCKMTACKRNFPPNYASLSLNTPRLQ